MVSLAAKEIKIQRGLWAVLLALSLSRKFQAGSFEIRLQVRQPREKERGQRRASRT